MSTVEHDRDDAQDDIQWGDPPYEGIWTRRPVD